MRHPLKIAGLAALLGAGAFAAPEMASAQGFSVRIGPDRDRVIERRDDYREPRVIERRVVREPRVIERRVVREPRVIERRIITPAPRRTVCTTQYRTTVRANGTIVRRPTEVCRTR